MLGARHVPGFAHEAHQRLAPDSLRANVRVGVGCLHGQAKTQIKGSKTEHFAAQNDCCLLRQHEVEPCTGRRLQYQCNAKPALKSIRQCVIPQRLS